MESEYIVLSILISILPVIIPEVRQWVEMYRKVELEDRLAAVEQDLQEMRDEVGRLKRRGKRK